MLPAQQGLEAGDASVADVALRLIHQPQFVARDRKPQIMFQQPALAHLGAHLGLEEAIGVAAFGLGSIERGVGVGEQGVTVSGVVGTDGDADAGRDAVDLRHCAGHAQRLQNGLGEPACRGGIGHTGHQDREFVAAEARHHLALVQHRGDARGHRLQHCVAGGVAEQIVDFLEPVEVEAKHGEAFAFGQRRDFLVDPGVEMTAIGQRRQCVVMGEVMDMLLGFLARLQIAHGDDLMRPSREVDRPQDQFDRRHRAVRLPHGGLDRLTRAGQ